MAPMVLLERRIGHLPAHKLAADGARFRALGAQAVGLPAKTRGALICRLKKTAAPVHFFLAR